MQTHFILLIAYVSLATQTSNTEQEPKIMEAEKELYIVSSEEVNRAYADSLTGFWKLKLEAYDNNENKILDEEERKQGIKNNYSLRFNADGSCKIVESFKGHYEVKSEKGNKMLYVYRNRVEGEEKQDPPPDIYRIISMSKNELVLLETEGNLTFWIFERIG